VRAFEASLDSLTASGDYALFDEIPFEWMGIIDARLLPELEAIYLAGGVNVWAAAPVGAIPPQAAQSWASVVNEAAREYLGRRRNFLVGVGDSLFQGVIAEVDRAILTGTSAEEIKKSLEQLGNFSEFRADTIARTEINNAYVNGNYESAQAMGEYGPVEKMWLATSDARTRPSHRDSNGALLPFSEPFVVDGEEMQHPHDDNASAANNVNCVLEGETVLPIGELLSISRARWDGESIEIVTSDGVSLRVTPNHPILTVTGFKPASQINCGDQIVTLGQTINDPRNDDRPPRVDELYRACRQAPMSLVHITSSMNFHGDRPDGDIEIVWPDGCLSLGVEIGKHLHDREFVGVGNELTQLLASGGGSSSPEVAVAQMISQQSSGFVSRDAALPVTSRSLVGGESESTPVTVACLGETNQVGFTAASDRQAHLAQASVNDVSGESEPACHSENADTGVVGGSEFPFIDLDAPGLSSLRQIAEGNAVFFESGADRLVGASVSVSDGRWTFAQQVSVANVVDVKIKFGSHWVYNLTSASGFLWSPGAVHSNCRCILLEFWPRDIRPDGSVVGEGEQQRVDPNFLKPLDYVGELM
jgi:SPP1 gp7 family putative phage head morphogenesis protein